MAKSAVPRGRGIRQFPAPLIADDPMISTEPEVLFTACDAHKLKAALNQPAVLRFGTLVPIASGIRGIRVGLHQRSETIGRPITLECKSCSFRLLGGSSSY